MPPPNGADTTDAKSDVTHLALHDASSLYLATVGHCLAVEIGLLAVALTPVIVTGGIDLSVGSLMGLCAVVFGMLWKDGGLGIVPAALLTLAAGAAAGGLNGWVITRFNAAPLIVTLATYSLFRGLAEGLTQALRSFSLTAMSHTATVATTHTLPL